MLGEVTAGIERTVITLDYTNKCNIVKRITTMYSLLRSHTYSLSDEEREIAVDAFYEVVNQTLLSTLVLVAICEVASHKTVRELRKTKEGASLHNSGIATTLFNFFVLAIPVHVAARLYVQHYHYAFG